MLIRSYKNLERCLSSSQRFLWLSLSYSVILSSTSFKSSASAYYSLVYAFPPPTRDQFSHLRLEILHALSWYWIISFGLLLDSGLLSSPISFLAIISPTLISYGVNFYPSSHSSSFAWLLMKWILLLPLLLLPVNSIETPLQANSTIYLVL